MSRKNHTSPMDPMVSWWLCFLVKFEGVGGILGVASSSAAAVSNVINEEHAGCLGYTGDYTAQLYGDCDKPI